MPNDTLIIRADAGLEMGTGHVMRCLALAQEWQDAGGHVVFAMAQSSAAVDRRLRSEGIEIFKLKTASAGAEDTNGVIALARDWHAEWVVVDGYQFDVRYQRRIKNAGLKLLLVDDRGQCGAYLADIVLNQNVYAVEDMYRNREPHTELLLGPRYALLRREFRSWRNWQREVARDAQNVLITMGGSDPHNVTAGVLEALRSVKIGMEVTVVVGGSNPHAKSLRQSASRLPRALLMQNGATNMAELMAWADVAVTAGGCTCYELALLRVPMVVVTIADNQAMTSQALSRHEAAVDVGWFDSLASEALAEILCDLIPDQERRQRLTDNARRLVDGEGAHRVLESMVPTHNEAIARAHSA
jgi:UDP-2,4-diacetamido-2,4,6-trideoxy-beta-L-altropyranose hydrolase